MDIREQTIRELAADSAQGAESIIRKGLPDSFHIGDVSCFLYPDGKRVFSYCGKAFLELYPVEFSTEEEVGASVKLKATQRYRYLRQVR